MTMMTTIIAVALGLTPVHGDGTVRPISNHDESMIGSFTETVDDTGTTHLRGVNRMTGELYHITVNPHGRVQGSVGGSHVTFNVRAAS
jgi:hypothetical protein